MLILNKHDIQACITMPEVIQANKEALKIYSQGNSVIPLRTNLNVASQHGQSLYMPGFVDGEQKSLGIKIVAVYPENAPKGLPVVPATMIVQDPATGIVNAVMDGTYLTQLRTGAVQGAGTDLLARKDAKIGALIGTGGQAETQLQALISVRNLEQIRIFDIDQAHAHEFATRMSTKYGCNCFAVASAQECVTDADIIVTVTTSKVPTFKAAWVKKGAHISGVGSYTPDMNEIPKELVASADIIVFDTTAGVTAEAGDFINPIKEGLITADKYTGELGELILNKIPGRTSDDQITIFKSVGTSVLDVYVANLIVDKAKAQNIGVEIAID